MRFDWYSATVAAPFENLSRCLSAEYEWAQPATVKPFPRYDYATQWTCGDEQILRMDYQHEKGSALVSATSHNAPRAAGYLREHWTHSVSRLDVCEDYTGEGVFEQLDSLFVGIAVQHGVRLDQAGDWLRQNGRTRYIGSKKSTTLTRVYEKGWQQYADAKANGTKLPEDFDITRTRVETQLRPPSKDKQAAAKYSCADVVAYSTWTRDANLRLTGYEIATPLKESRGRSPHAKKLHHLAKQYGLTLKAELARLDGSFELLGKSLIDAVNDIEASTLRTAASRAKPSST